MKETFKETFIKWNMICERGHLHYSPEPMGWVGLPCNTQYENKNRKKVVCRKPRVLMEDYKPLIVPKIKKKKKKKRKFVSRY